NPQLSKEAAGISVWCFTQNSECYKQWVKEKFAFWINLYNALIMHAYLAYGVPRSDLKLFSLMQRVWFLT
ncbi:hypothetical protein LINPERPRIM_LOCUS32308, partial [Linum perenne]